MRRTLVVSQLLAAPTWAWAARAEPSRSEPVVVGGDLLVQMTLGLLVVLALAIGLSWLLRRYALPRDGLIRVVGGLPVGTKERLVVIEVEQVRLLIGVTSQRIDTLHVLAAPPTAPFSLTQESQHEPPTA